MKKHNLLLGTICLVSACLTSCGTSISLEEAKKIIESYDKETALSSIKTLQVEYNANNSSITTSIIYHFDLENTYLYVNVQTSASSEGTSSLITNINGKYYYISNIVQEETQEITEEDAKGYIDDYLSSIKKGIFIDTEFLSHYDTIPDVKTDIKYNITVNKNALNIKASGTFEYSYQGTKINDTISQEIQGDDKGLILYANGTSEGETINVTVTYNKPISKKTSL